MKIVVFEAVGNGRMYVFVNNQPKNIADPGFPVTVGLNNGDVLTMSMQPFIGASFAKLCDVPQTECRSVSVTGSKLVYKYDITDAASLPDKMVATFTAATVSPPPEPAPVKPPAVGDAETYFDSYHGYNVYTVSGSYTARRPSGTSIGYFTTLQAAFDGIDADLASLTADVDRAAREAAKAAADKAAADAALALEEAAKAGTDGTDKTDYSTYIVAAVIIAILLVLILRRK